MGPWIEKMFDEYIIKFLAPTLRAGDIVIMDNLKCPQIGKSKRCDNPNGSYSNFSSTL